MNNTWIHSLKFNEWLKNEVVEAPKEKDAPKEVGTKEVKTIKGMKKGMKK